MEQEAVESDLKTKDLPKGIRKSLKEPGFQIGVLGSVTSCPKGQSKLVIDDCMAKFFQ